MTKIKRGKLRFPSLSALEDIWQREATRVAIKEARAVVSSGAVPPMTPIGRLSDVEWGWLAAAVLFGWINTRAQQATSNGIGLPDQFRYIREAGFEPDPWDVGAIEAALPELANSESDWTKPLAAFSREEMIAFLADAYTLIQKAMIARDKGERLVTRRLPLSMAKTDEKDWDDPMPSFEK